MSVAERRQWRVDATRREVDQASSMVGIDGADMGTVERPRTDALR
jgi:hypothetical protein